MRENGGSRMTLCGEKMQSSRTSLETTKLPPSDMKKRLRRSGDTLSSRAPG